MFEVGKLRIKKISNVKAYVESRCIVWEITGNSCRIFLDNTHINTQNVLV